jgi:hypothetical protein
LILTGVSLALYSVLICCSSVLMPGLTSAHASLQDHVASPAEIAKAYMGSKSNNGSSLRLRLHDPSSLTMKSMEANTIQQARPLTIPLQGSRLHSSKNSDHYKRNVSTPNRSAIYKMSSSPYFKVYFQFNLSVGYCLFNMFSVSHDIPTYTNYEFPTVSILFLSFLSMI